MSLLLDVLQIVPRRSACRIPLAHITEPSSELGEPLTIGALA
jgi:hypothetical protein